MVPLALARPRFDPLWLVPLAFWFVPGTYNGAPWQTALALAVGAATVALAVLAPRTAERGDHLVRSPLTPETARSAELPYSERETSPRALGVARPASVTRLGRGSSPV